MPTDIDGLAQGGGQPAQGLPQQPQTHHPDPAGARPQVPTPGAAPAAAAPGDVTLGNQGKPIPPAIISARIRQAAERARAEERARVLQELNIRDPGDFQRERGERDRELEELRTQEEKRKRESMTEQERLRNDLEAAKARIAELEAERDQLVTSTQRKEQDEQLTSIALKHIAPKHVGYAVRHAFREYVMGLGKEEIAKLGQNKGEIERWFRRFAREYPELAASGQDAKAADEAAKAAAEATTAKPATPVPLPRPKVVVRKITNGISPQKITAPPAVVPGADPTLAGKTPIPGLPNSMTKAEVRRYAQQQGHKMP